MKLPNASFAVIEQKKLVEYLLNPRHRSGASKARFFFGFGFRPQRWQALAKALRVHAQKNDVCRERYTGFGVCYEVDGPLVTPDGRGARVRTVWLLEAGAVAPRLVTAYPLAWNL